MKLLVRMAWRNVWRHKRRSVLTILAVTFATLFTVAMRGLGLGTWEFNVVNTVELFTGYLQVQRQGYLANPSLQKSFAFPGVLDSILRAAPAIKGYTPRIETDGLVSLGTNSSGAAIFGIDPAREQGISRFAKRINGGRFLNGSEVYEVVLGYKLLDNLGARVGDTVVVLSQGFDGVMGNLLFRVCGTLKVGSPELDGSAVLMDLRAAQELLAMEGRVNVVAIAVRNLKAIPVAREAISSSLPPALAGQLAVLSWDEVIPELKQAMDFDTIGDWFFFVILIVIVTFGILNTILMSVTERFREFGVVLALGMRPATIAMTVMLETAFIAIVGIIAGGAAGYAVNARLEAHPIPLSGEFGAIYEEYGFIPQIVSSSNINIVFVVAAVMAGLAFLSSLYPIYRVLKLEPLKGIRYT